MVYHAGTILNEVCVECRRFGDGWNEHSSWNRLVFSSLCTTVLLETICNIGCGFPVMIGCGLTADWIRHDLKGHAAWMRHDLKGHAAWMRHDLKGHTAWMRQGYASSFAVVNSFSKIIMLENERTAILHQYITAYDTYRQSKKYK